MLTHPSAATLGGSRRGIRTSRVGMTGRGTVISRKRRRGSLRPGHVCALPVRRFGKMGLCATPDDRPRAQATGSDNDEAHGRVVGKDRRSRAAGSRCLLETLPLGVLSGTRLDRRMSRRDVVGHPMMPRTRGRIWIIAEDDKASSSRRCAAPIGGRGHVFAIAGEATWDR